MPTNKNQPGCNCCGVGTHTLTINGCDGLPEAGASVTLTKSGVVLGPSLTGADGKVAFSIPSTGTWTRAVTATNFPNHSSTASIGTGTTSATINIGTATGYICCLSCHWPIPNSATLTLSDGYGTYTLTGSGGVWVVNVDIAASVGSTTGGSGFCNAGADTPGTTRVQYGFVCTGLFAWTLSVNQKVCFRVFPGVRSYLPNTDTGGGLTPLTTNLDDFECDGTTLVATFLSVGTTDGSNVGLFPDGHTFTVTRP